MTGFDFNRVDLDRIKVCIDYKIDRYAIHHDASYFGSWIDHFTNHISVQYSAFVLGENQKPIRLKPYPTSWWQMFKRDVMPKWFQKRFPVKSEEYVIDAKVIYPYLRISAPLNEKVSVIFQQSPSCIVP